jgi:predicted dehydrogenase
LIGEIGIHQVDAMCWFLDKRPTAITGFGSLVYWTDGRDVDDTIQAVFEYPDGVHGTYEGTLANSFDSDYEIYHGAMATVLVRGTKAWMFKEADSPMLGWEVYARKDTFYKETGIALMANATKLTTVTAKALEEETFEETPIYNALAAFLYNSHLTTTGIADFTSTFGEDETGLKDYLSGMDKDRLPYATAADGHAATVTVLKANEAIRKRQRLVFKEEWYEI